MRRSRLERDPRNGAGNLALGELLAKSEDSARIAGAVPFAFIRASTSKSERIPSRVVSKNGGSRSERLHTLLGIFSFEQPRTDSSKLICLLVGSLKRDAPSLDPEVRSRFGRPPIAATNGLFENARRDLQE